MEFRILGSIEAETGRGLIDLGTFRQRQLLALLLLSAGEPVSTDRLAEDLWSGDPPDTARHTLQAYVYRLRQVLGGEAERLQTRDGRYRMKVSPSELDSLRFQELAEQGHRVLLTADPQAAADLLAEALGLWRGQVLADLGDLVAFEPERARLDTLRLTALEDRVEADLALGRQATLVAELEALVSEHPFRERMWGQLMLALYRSGRQADALAAFQRARKVLGEELGLEPGPWLAELEGHILLQDPALHGPATERPRLPPHNLPVPRTSFVGRRHELADLEGLLALRRFVTTTGPPGAGKTRLALEAARAAGARYPHGIFFVSLAEIADPELVPSAIGAALGVWTTDPPMIEALATYLRPRRLLLVLDNFEHVLAGVGVVGRLLDAAPGLAVLATSRAPLRLSGEQEYPLGPLPPPLPEQVVDEPTGVDALALFADRARAVDPGFDLNPQNARLAQEVVNRVDRLPLGIELAAARLRLFPLAELAARLDPALPFLTQGSVDRPLRQQTLRDAITWSHDLLHPAERAAFRRLSAFRGSFTLEAAQAVTAAPPVEDVTDAISNLVEVSLIGRPVEPGPARFSMLETIRQYAGERLVEAAEDQDTARRHAEYYAEMVKEAEPELTGPHRNEWLERLSVEHPNLRAALGWARDRGATEVALLMAGRMWRFWQLRGHLAEGRHWLEELLAAGERAATVPRVKALIGMAGICYWQADFERAESAYWEALDLLERLDDWWLRAEAIWGQVATLVCQSGKIPAALPLEREFLALADAHPQLAPMVNAVSGTVKLFSGDIDGARQYAERGLTMMRQAGDPWWEGEAARALGHISFAQGRYQEAEENLRLSLRIGWEMGNLTGVVTDLNWLGRAAVAQGWPEEGVMLAGAASRLRETVGGGLTVQDFAFDVEDPEEAALRVLGQLQIDQAWARGRAISLDDAVAVALGASVAASR